MFRPRINRPSSETIATDQGEAVNDANNDPIDSVNELEGCVNGDGDAPLKRTAASLEVERQVKLGGHDTHPCG